MTAGAVAAILYRRCRQADPTFQVESEEELYGQRSKSWYILGASWSSENGRTYTAALALGYVQDLAALLDGCLRALDRRAREEGS